MKETTRREEDLVVGYSDKGIEGTVYDPIILKLAVIGAILLGGIFGLLGYLVAEGSWAIVDFGQISAVYTATAAITTAGVGMALGGLIGALVGTYRMLNKSEKSDVY